MRFMQTDGGRQFSKRPRQTNDCVVRTLAAVCHVSYDRAYEVMRDAGRRSNGAAFFPPDGHRRGRMGDYDEVFGHSFVWEHNSYGLTFVKFCNLNAHGRFVLCQATHVAALIDGVLLDDHPWRLREGLAGWWTVTKIRG